MKKVIIIGLGYQGKIFINYFKKNKIEIIGVCKSEQTKKNIIKDFGINVYIDYKQAVNENLDTDLIVLCAYPIIFYEEFFNFIFDYNIKILTDLPISFNLDFLKKIVENKNVYFLLLETKLFLFKNILDKNISRIECNLYFNRENLLSIKNPKEFLLVDSQYLYNNFLGFDLSKIKLNFFEKKTVIKNLEYSIIIDENFIYKYEDGRYFYFDKKNNIKKTSLIIYDDLLDEILFDIKNGKNLYKKEYFENFSYLFKKYYV